MIAPMRGAQRDRQLADQEGGRQVSPPEQVKRAPRGKARPIKTASIVKLRLRGKTIKQICGATGHWAATVRKALDEAGLSSRDAVARRVSKADQMLADPKVRAIIDAARAEEIADLALCAQLGVKEHVVREIRAKIGWVRDAKAERLDADARAARYAAIKRLHGEGLDVNEIAAELGISRSSTDFAVKTMKLDDGWPAVRPGLFDERMRAAVLDRIQASAGSTPDHMTGSTRRQRRPEQSLPAYMPIDRHYQTSQSSIA